VRDDLSEVERESIRDKLNLWLIGVAGVVALLVIRFWVLQVVQYETWAFFARDNQIRRVVVPAMRGNIFDRNHQLLADWRQSFNVTVVPADLTDESLFRLAEILSVTPEELRGRMQKNHVWSRFVPVVVAEDLNWRELTAVEENRISLPGVDTEIRPVRQYGNGSGLFSHVLGYLGEVTPEELADPRYAQYRMGDWVGRAGVERMLETTLRGQDGYSFRLVDARGRQFSADHFANELEFDNYREKFKELEEMSQMPRPGYSAVLTLDLRLQVACAREMGHNYGSVVAVDPQTGEILALYSSPVYDPSVFTGGDKAERQRVLLDPDKPLYNRALQGIYPPGSIFKIVMAAAGLETGAITPKTRFSCPGYFTFGKVKFACWKHAGHGSMFLEIAIMQSCDVFFYNLGNRLRIDRIGEWCRKFGLGAPLGIGFSNEKTGLVPSEEWSERVRHHKWYPGETISVAIGQGALSVTPLQAVMIAAAVANNGRLMQPQLIHHLEDLEGKPVTRFQPRARDEQLFSPATAVILRAGMTRVVQDPSGTARKFVYNPDMLIAGKTGTAEVSKKFIGRHFTDVPYAYRDHAWFISFAPSDHPRIAMVVMIEHGGAGGMIAGTISRRIYEDYFGAPTTDPPGAIPGSGPAGSGVTGAGGPGGHAITAGAGHAAAPAGAAAPGRARAGQGPAAPGAGHGAVFGSAIPATVPDSSHADTTIPD